MPDPEDTGVFIPMEDPTREELDAILAPRLYDLDLEAPLYDLDLQEVDPDLDLRPIKASSPEQRCDELEAAVRALTARVEALEERQGGQRG